MPEPRPAAIRPNVRDHLDRLDRAVAQLHAENRELRHLLAESGPGAPAAEPSAELNPGWAMKLTLFLERTGIPRRTFYYLRERGKLRTIVVGDRSLYVLTDSYLDLVRQLDREQNAPGRPPHRGVNPPPRPRSRSDAGELGSLGNAVPRNSPP
jgi:hypothetical protein